MRFLRRSGDLPAAAREALALGSDEQVLAWAELAAAAGFVALTRRQLHAAIGRAEPLHIDWDAVEHAAWDDPLMVVTFHSGDQRLRLSMELPAVGAVPQVLRERVSATVVYDGYRTLPDGQRVRFIARRGLDSPQPRWQTRYEVAEPDAALCEAAAAALTALRADIGL